MSGVVLVERNDSVTRITLNRPGSYNALNMEMFESLSSAIRDCFDDGSRVVVIRAEGKAFCSGGDLDYMISQKSISDALANLTKVFHRIVTDIRLLPKPVLAALNGTAAGGGVSLALACDLRIASERTRFKQAYTSSGLVPDGGWSLLVPAVIGLAKASEAVFLDEVLDARQALELGLVTMVVPESEFEQKVEETAKKLKQGATKAYAAAKTLLNQSMLPLLEIQLERERQAITSIGKTKDAQEGLAAFLEKRRPTYSGK